MSSRYVHVNVDRKYLRYSFWVCGFGHVQYWTSGEFLNQGSRYVLFFSGCVALATCLLQISSQYLEHEFKANVAMSRNILHTSDVFYRFYHFPYWKLSIGKWLWPRYMQQISFSVLKSDHHNSVNIVTDRLRPFQDPQFGI